MNELSQFVTQLGFPCFVAVWMLYKSNKDDKQLLDALNILESSVKELITYIHTMKEMEQAQFESNSRVMGAIESMGKIIMAKNGYMEEG